MKKSCWISTRGREIRTEAGPQTAENVRTAVFTSFAAAGQRRVVGKELRAMQGSKYVHLIRFCLVDFFLEVAILLQAVVDGSP